MAEGLFAVSRRNFGGVTSNADSAPSVSSPERMDHKLIAILLLTALPYPAQASFESSTTDAGDAATASMRLFSGFVTSGLADIDRFLGGQATVKASARLSAKVQLISQRQYDDTHAPKVAWANIKYEVTPELSRRVGSTVLSSHPFSKSRGVGCANPWVWQPIEVYGRPQVLNHDRADATYKRRVGEIVHALQATYESVRNNILERGSAETKPRATLCCE